MANSPSPLLSLTRTAVLEIVGGRLDVLMSFAGCVLRDGREFEQNGFERVIGINLNGTMRLCSLCKPLLQAGNGGNIMICASMLRCAVIHTSNFE